MASSPLLYDCFLYVDQRPYRELLEIRLTLLRDIVDKFVIVCSRETFAGPVNPAAFPAENRLVSSCRDQIELVMVDRLEGGSARAREAYARNKIRDGLSYLSDDDLVMISDIDEIPRPEVLRRVRRDAQIDDILVLGLDYFNFKFNYKLIHGLEMVWAGPLVTRFKNMPSPQELRIARWSNLAYPARRILDAGWHFSFLTGGDDVTAKLISMFTPREREWRGFPDGARRDRRNSVSALIAARQGFHDHMYGGSVWATIPPSGHQCDELTALLENYAEYMLNGPFDDPDLVAEKVRLAMWRLYGEEIPKVLQNATSRELTTEACNRILMRAHRIYRYIGRSKGSG
jgi:beta-1,4-mannosyl-glycoprotein beta-1,4-N-acetylglucosaminyltransferase